MRSRTRFRLADLAVVAIVAAATVLLATFTSWRGSPASHTLPPVRALVLTGATGPTIPAGFLGVSTEFAALIHYAGQKSNALNPLFVRLLRQLDTSHHLSLRIGGDSTDTSWWPVPGLARPPGINYTLGHPWTAVASALTRALGAHLILGINLEANNVELALTEARELTAGLPAHSIDAFELGNEPGLYSRFPYYHTADHRPVMGRPRSYGYAAFVNDFNRFSATLLGDPLAGPGVGYSNWLLHLSSFLAGQSEVKLVTLHRYPLQRCFTHPGSPQYPSIANLLAPAATAGIARDLAPYVAVAHAHHLPLRVDELNSVSCGPKRAVSQSFATALWSLNVLFALAGVGVDGVNIHTFPGAGYELFTFKQSGGHWEAQVSPEYYGLLAFARIAPAGAQLLTVRQQRSSSVTVWATRTRRGSLHVVAVNSGTAERTVIVKLSSAHGAASSARTAILERLIAPALQSQSGVTLVGQSFSSPTQTAKLEGAAVRYSVEPVSGTYEITVPAGSAAILTVL